MIALLLHQDLFESILREGLEALSLNGRVKAKDVMMKAYSALLLSFGVVVLREVVNQDSLVKVWERLQTLFLRKSLANRLILKKKH